MKYKSLLLSEASGSIGGLVFSHNKGGLYIRARTIPTNPGSPAQDVIRAAFGALVAAWVEVLTEAQREAWRYYAAGTPLLDPLGDVRTVTGMNMYLRCNTLRMAFGFPVQDTAPPYNNLGYMTAPQFTVDEATQLISVTFSDQDEWVDEDDSHMVIYASRPQNESVNYFKGPYQLAGSIEGDSITPPTSPTTLPLPFAAVAGHRIFLMACVSRADGRRSLNFRDHAPTT